MSRLRPLVGLAASLALGTSACSTTTTALPSDTLTNAPPTSVAATEAPLVGHLTVWDAYGASGEAASAERLGFGQVLDWMRARNPGLTIDVTAIDAAALDARFEHASALGGGPDMLIGPNDSLGSEARSGYLVDLTGRIDATLASVSDVARGGSMVGDRVYAVPESITTLVLVYDGARVSTPPATTDELLAYVRRGGTLGLTAGPYDGWGFYSAFGGSILDPASGRCTATATTGVADAMAFVRSLGAQSSTVVRADAAKVRDAFIAGDLDMVLSDSRFLRAYETARPAVAVAPFPSGPSGPGRPIVGVDGWYINAAAPTGQQQLAIAAAQEMVSQPAEEIMEATAHHAPANVAVSPRDRLVRTVADIAATGDLRPQSAPFDNYWGPWARAWSAALASHGSSGGDIPSLVAKACSAMDAANGLTPSNGPTPSGGPTPSSGPTP